MSRKHGIEIAGCLFFTQKELHETLNTMRTSSEDDFDAWMKCTPAAEILAAMMMTRPSKASELRGRCVVAWTRFKCGPHMAFQAILCDGSLLDMGVSRGDVSEFWRAWLKTGPDRSACVQASP